jgi:hypothetical protein
MKKKWAIDINETFCSREKEGNFHKYYIRALFDS